MPGYCQQCGMEYVVCECEYDPGYLLDREDEARAAAIDELMYGPIGDPEPKE